MEEPKLGFATRAIHAGQIPDPTTGAVMTPVYMTSTFAQEGLGKPRGGYEYARTANPTRTALEQNLASLEGGKYAFCFASGCASQDALLHLLKTGDHVVLCDDVYGGTFRQFDKIFKQLGIAHTRVDMTDPEGCAAAVNENTKMVWMESPTNPMMKIIDIAAMSRIAKRHGALLVCDNTFATPVLTNPLELGADIVLHSSTKYLGGHSDLVGGGLILNDDELAARLKFIQNAVGAIPGPMDCFMVLRSTKTLQLRVERACQNARKIAAFLEEHPKIKKVIYPGLPSHPQHEIARRQMRDFGAMITVELEGNLETARRFLEKVRIFFLAESLGGVESLLEHPAVMTHASVPPEQRHALGITETLVRLSIGIEEADDLIADLDQALES